MGLSAVETWDKLRRKTGEVTWAMARASMAAYEASCHHDLDAMRAAQARASRLQAARVRLIRASGVWLGRALNEE